MPVLDKKLFTGDSELEPDECAKLEIKNNTSDINICLAEYTAGRAKQQAA
jgi:hypothetical protein